MMSNAETSIIMSNVCQIYLSTEKIKNKHLCFQISKSSFLLNHFGILIYILPWKYLFRIFFKLLRRNKELKINSFLRNIWRNNWCFINVTRLELTCKLAVFNIKIRILFQQWFQPIVIWIVSVPWNMDKTMAWSNVFDAKATVSFFGCCSFISMTPLLTHTVVHFTRPSFRPKTKNQPLKKF